MKKGILIVLLAFLGANYMYSQSQAKGAAKKKNATTSVQKKMPGKNTGTSQKKNSSGKSSEGLSQEYLVNNVEGKHYVAIVPFSKYYPKHGLVYDTHTLRTTVIAIFDFTEKFVIYMAGSAIDKDLVRYDDDRGSLILQNNLAEDLNRDPCQCKLQQEGNIFTFVEEYTKNGKSISVTHKYRYDKQTDSFYDLDKGITLNVYQR